MDLNRGGHHGDNVPARDGWQQAPHNKVMPPTERVVRHTGETNWRAEPPQGYGRHYAPDIPRASAIPFNKFALDKDQDGVLDEAMLFRSTTLGMASAEREMDKASSTVAERRSRKKGHGGEEAPRPQSRQGMEPEGYASPRGETSEHAAAVAFGGGTGAALPPQQLPEGGGGDAAGGSRNDQPGIGGIGGGGEDVDAPTLAARRALVGEILQRNGPQLHMIALNPGTRFSGDRLAAAKKKEEGAARGGLTHFSAQHGLDANLDAAMAMVDDPATYEGNFPLFVKDLYLAENKAKITGSSQMKRVLQPARANVLGGQSALNPPPSRFNGNAQAAAWETMGGDAGGQVRPSTAPEFIPGTVRGFGATGGSRGSHPSDPGTAAGMFSPIARGGTKGNNNNGGGGSSSISSSSFGSVSGGAPFTSAYRIATHVESDHAEAYEGQWAHSKTLCPTSRGVRQAGEHAPSPGGVGKPGRSERRGRATVTRHLGPSRPNTTTGVSSNSAEFGNTFSLCNGLQRRPPPGRWAQPDRGRQLPVVLHDSATQEGVKPFYFEPPVYNREHSDAHTNLNSMSAWTSKAASHDAGAWKRSPNTLLTGSVYQATLPRSRGSSGGE